MGKTTVGLQLTWCFLPIYLIAWHFISPGWYLSPSLSWVSEWVKSLSLVRLFATPWTVAYQAPPSMGFSRQEYWGRLPFPSPGDLPDPGIEPRSPAFQADTLTSEPPGKPWHFFPTDQETSSWRWAYLPQTTEQTRSQEARWTGLPSPNTQVQSPVLSLTHYCTSSGHGWISVHLIIFISNRKMMMLRVMASTSGTSED